MCAENLVFGFSSEKPELAIIIHPLSKKYITEIDEINEKIGDRIFLWKGDITTLQVDAITNAANSGLLGCFQPHHNCIDNAIHSASGLALRNACHEIMTKQDKMEKAGGAVRLSALLCYFIKLYLH